MKKLFTLIGALLLWQSVAVAQNELHIWTGDTTKIVRLAELDSVTVRDAEFYKIDLNNVNGLRFTGRVSDYWGSVYSFNVTLAQGEGTTVYIQNLDPYFAENGFTAADGSNILAGELVVAADGKSATITCQLAQAIGYNDFMFYNPFGGTSIDFALTDMALECTTGYGVCNAEGQWYTAFTPFTLHVAAGAAPARKAKAMELKPLKVVKQLKPLMMTQKQNIEAAKTGALQLMTMPADQTIK